MPEKNYTQREEYFHPDDPAGWLKPGDPLMVDGLDWSWAFVIYKVVPDFPGYCVGSNGTVWSRNVRENLGGHEGFRYSLGDEWIRKSASSGRKKKDPGVSLFRNGQPHRFRLGRLVLITFIGPCPSGKECLHRDDDPWNNRLSNVRWGTSKENHADAVRNGRKGPGEKSPCARLTESIVLEIRETYAAGGVTLKQLAATHGITKWHACSLVNGESWSHVGGPLIKRKVKPPRMSEEDEERVREMVAGGLSKTETGRRFKVTRKVITRITRCSLGGSR